MVLNLEKRLRTDPAHAREELARYFRDGRIHLLPQPGRFCVAKSAVLPLAVLTTTPSKGPRDGVIQRLVARACNDAWATGWTLPLMVRLAA